MALNVKQQIKKQGFETSQRKKKTERRYSNCLFLENVPYSKRHEFYLFTCRCARQGRSQGETAHDQNFTLHQSPLMSCLTSGWLPKDVAYHKPDSLSQLETQYFCVVELGETAVMWYK